MSKSSRPIFRIVTLSFLVLAIPACGKSEGTKKVDPAYLAAIQAMEKEVCRCAKDVPRNQAQQCLGNRKAKQPKVPGGGDVMKYLASLRPEDRKAIETSEASRRACLDMIASTSP